MGSVTAMCVPRMSPGGPTAASAAPVDATAVPSGDRGAVAGEPEVSTDDLPVTSSGRRVDRRERQGESRAASSTEPTDRIPSKERAMYVLVWSDNRILSDLVARNLRRRGFDVDERPLSAAASPGPIERHAPDLAIVDLDCLEPELWRRAARLRSTVPETPVVILGHAWPTPARLDPLQPCTYVRKPFAIDALLDAVQDVPTAVGRSR